MVFNRYTHNDDVPQRPNVNTFIARSDKLTSFLYTAQPPWWQPYKPPSYSVVAPNPTSTTAAAPHCCPGNQPWETGVDVAQPVPGGPLALRFLYILFCRSMDSRRDTSCLKVGLQRWHRACVGCQLVVHLVI